MGPLWFLLFGAPAVADDAARRSMEAEKRRAREEKERQLEFWLDYETSGGEFPEDDDIKAEVG
jgi:hypothetical protein